MNYYSARTLRGDFDAVVAKVTQGLKDQGFGVLTEIDVAATLKQKLGVDMPRYRILGACNPSFAHQAIGVEENIGVMLPCNVVVRDKSGGNIEIAAIDPRAAMAQIGNPALTKIADQVADGLSRALASV
jgi:uncharacterized protein (DUF302 family)